MVSMQGHWCARFCARFPSYALFYLNIIIGYCGLGGWLLCPLLPRPGSCVTSSAELRKGEQMEWAVPLPRAATWAMEPTCCLVSYVGSPRHAVSSEVLFFPFRVFRTLEKPPVRSTCLSSTFYKWENWRPEKDTDVSATELGQSIDFLVPSPELWLHPMGWTFQNSVHLFWGLDSSFKYWEHIPASYTILCALIHSWLHPESSWGRM